MFDAAELKLLLPFFSSDSVVLEKHCLLVVGDCVVYVLPQQEVVAGSHAVVVRL